MGYVLVSCGSNYNFAVGNNTYVTTQCEDVVEHLRSVLEEKMAENIYTRGNYKLKAPPIKVLDALTGMGYTVISSGGSEGRFIWTLIKSPAVTSIKVNGVDVNVVPDHHASQTQNEQSTTNHNQQNGSSVPTASPIDLHSYSPDSIINA